MNSVIQLLPMVARVLIGFYFIFFALWTIYHWKPVINVMIDDAIPCPWLVLQVGIVYQAVTGGMIVTGFMTSVAATALIPFVMLAAFIFHPFWKRRGEMFRLHFTLFMLDLTLLPGALLLFLAC